MVFTGGKIIPSNTLLNNQWFLNLQDLVQLERVLKCRLKTLISRSNVGEVNNVLNSGQITSNSTTNSTRTPRAIIPRRHRRAPLRDSIQKITKADVRRLARRGGVKRINGLIVNEVRGVLKVFLGGIIQDAIEITLYKKKKNSPCNGYHIWIETSWKVTLWIWLSFVVPLIVIIILIIFVFIFRILIVLIIIITFIITIYIFGFYLW